MEFRHLPEAGGLYDQDPQLLEDWQAIWKAQARHRRNEEKRKKARSKNNTKTGHS